MSDPRSYNVGWICALGVEYVAAQEFLDEEHDKPSFVSPNDTNEYALGKMGDHKVVIAVLPDGEYGTASAATVAANMMNSFPNVRIGLMVGIGGGAPSHTHDIRLGDIVVSAPRNGTGGVFQYDFGKVIQEQTFQHTGFLNQPPSILRGAVAGVQAQYERKGHQIEEAINIVLHNNPRLRQKYGRPESKMDTLFRSDVIHEAACAAGSCTQVASNLVARRERTAHEDNPAIHYGLVASANQLMKDASIRDRLTAEKDVLCFEMEAGGLMNTFPCLVIRGICDYSDSHKNKGWQGHAAMVAAAYARDVLQRIQLSRVEAEERISQVISDHFKGNKELLDRAYAHQEYQYNEQKEQMLADKRQRCHRMFKTSNYEEQKNVNLQRAEGTCKWALQSFEYVRWCESNCNDLLWVSADPGCGKSVLARSIIDEWAQNPPSPGLTVCYFFFKENDKQNNLATALCSVLHQLFSQQPWLLELAIKPWEQNGDSLRQDVNELWEIFLKATSGNHPMGSSLTVQGTRSSKTICIFDALDECRESDQDYLIRKFILFHSKQHSTQDTYLKFLVTSRPYNSIENHFRTITDSLPYLHLKGEEENDQLHEEINTVVKIQVENLAETARLSSDVREKIEQHLLQLKHRTYLWLHLAMDDIRSTFENSLRPADELIEMIPPSVDEAYEKILRRVPSNKISEVRKVFQILLGARRPLTITEMAMALGISARPDSRTAAEAGIDPTLLERLLPSLCGLFVFFNNSKVYLIHLTARDYLLRETYTSHPLSTFSCSFTDVEDEMAQICLRYFDIEDFDSYDTLQSSNSPPFGKYSGVYWNSHVRHMSSIAAQEVRDLLYRVYSAKRKKLATRFGLSSPFFSKVMPPLGPGSKPELDSMQIAAIMGHRQEVLRLLLEGESKLKLAEYTTYHPLELAAEAGHSAVVLLILNNGGDVNACNGSALIAACVSNHSDIVQILLRHGADVNQRSESGTALAHACARDSIQIVQTLLSHGADPNISDSLGKIPLHSACGGGNEKMAVMLLEYGADINARDELGCNVLEATCIGGAANEKIILLLLEHGFDINTTETADGRSFLYNAFHNQDDKLMHILLKHGAGVNTRTSGMTILCFATSKRRSKVVEMMLDHGADVNARTEDSKRFQLPRELPSKTAQMLLNHGIDVNADHSIGTSALHIACLNQDNDLVQILLRHGADVNSQDQMGTSALNIACTNQYNDIVQTLLKHGADVNVLNQIGTSALDVACVIQNHHLVQTLLKHGADVNSQNLKGKSILQIACLAGNEGIVQTLLEHGANANLHDQVGTSALHIACANQDNRLVEILLKHRADVNSESLKGKSVLQIACLAGNENVVQTLLEHGADANLYDRTELSNLEIASLAQNNKLVQMLLKYGADVNAQSPNRRSFLEANCAAGNEEIVQILLDLGADRDIEGGRHSSALQIAELEGHKKIVQILLEHGAELQAIRNFLS
ncbi:hypothetical protein PEX1_044240 [Penicillium expansum]|nr:hypothetical protein PEX1_044240 [Penicillium expansum]KGO36986.1 hypothetical protein PEXP_007860 [Penicillium expansum]